jgi:hypothetical protein
MPGERREFEPPQGPIIEEIDMAGTWDTPSMLDTINDRLKSLGLYKPNLLYRGLDAGKIEVVLKHGRENIESKKFFASPEQEILSVQGDAQNAFEFATDYDEPGMAVYDGDKLEDLGLEEYKPKEGVELKDAVIAIFTLKF